MTLFRKTLLAINDRPRPTIQLPEPSMKIGKKLKATFLSERTQAFLLYVGVTIANAVLHLNLQVPPIEGGPSPLVAIGGATVAFIVGKSIRSSPVESTPHDPPTLS